MPKDRKKQFEKCSNQNALTNNKMNFKEDEFPHLISALDSATLDTKEYEDIRSPNSNLSLKNGSSKSFGVSSKLLNHPHVSNTESLDNNLDGDRQKTEYEMKDKPINLGDSYTDSDISNTDECCSEPPISVAPINNVYKTSPYTVDNTLSNLKFNSNLNVKAKEFIPKTFPTPSYQKCSYGAFDLKVLLEYNIKDINDDELKDYSYALREKAMNCASEFDYFVTEKLDFINDLMEETQTLRTQRLITERMHEILYKLIDKLDSSSSAKLHYSYPGRESSPKECGNFDMKEGYFRNTNSNRDEMYNRNKRQGNGEQAFSGQRNRNSDSKNNFVHERFLNRGNRNCNRGYLRHEQFSSMEKGNVNREGSNCEKYSGKENKSSDRDCSQDLSGRRKRNSNEKDFSASGKSDI